MRDQLRAQQDAMRAQADAMRDFGQMPDPQKLEKLQRKLDKLRKKLERFNVPSGIVGPVHVEIHIDPYDGSYQP